MLKENPILRLFFPFVAGIMLYSRLGIYISPWIFVVLLAVGFLVMYILYIRYSFYTQWLTSLFVPILMMLTGMGALALRKHQFRYQHFDTYLERGNAWLARVEDYGQEKVRTVKYVAAMEAVGDSQHWQPCMGKLIIYLEKDSSALLLQPGEKIVFHGTPLSIAGPALPGGFDYRAYLARRGIYHQVYLKSETWKRYPAAESVGLKQIAARVRGKMLANLKKYGLEGSEYAVASAILLGYSSALDAETRQIYQGSGAMHVLCVSGLHVGIIYMFLGILLAPLLGLKRGKQLRSIISLIAIWCYAVLTGLSPSVIRAATMFSFLSIGQMAGRRTAIYNTLAASAFFILLFNPYLLFEIGFQLSYLAVLGIVSIQPGLYQVLGFKNYLMDKVWSLITVSLAAQVATGPLATYYFHQFPTYFLVTNLWVIPISFGVMFLGVIFFLTSWIPPLAGIIGWLLAWGLRIMNRGVHFIENLPGSVIEGLYPGDFFTVGIYIFLVFTVLYFYFPRRYFFYGALATIAILSVKTSFQWLIFKDSHGEILFPSSNSAQGLIIVQGRWAAVSDSLSLNDRGVRDWLGSKGIKEISVLPVPSCFVWQGKVFCLARGDSILVPKSCRVDYLLLTGKMRDKPEYLLHALKPTVVIAGLDMPAFILKRWKEKLSGSSIRFHAVREKGYFLERIQPAKKAEAFASAASRPSG